MWNWEQLEAVPEAEKVQKRTIQVIEWTERLKKAWGWPIFILHGGNIWGGAAMAGELYAYLEDENNPLPKAFTGSSVWWVIALLMRESVKSVKPHNRTNRDIIRYRKEMRWAMKWALEKLYLEDLPSAAEQFDSLMWKLLWGMWWLITSWNPQNLKPIYDKFWYENIYETEWENHFDTIISYTQVNSESDMTWVPVLVANSNITPEIWDASSAFHWKDAELINWQTLWKDWNYSNYIKRLGEWIQDGEELIFFTSYSSQEQIIDTPCKDIIWTGLNKRLCVANEFVDTWLSYLTNVTWASVTTLRWNIENEDTRGELGSAKRIFLSTRMKARERKGIKEED